MIDYSQPDFYRFNEDSFKLVRYILESVTHSEALLDLGAGSGVIGIELAKILKPEILTLVETQEDYFSHLRKNCDFYLPPGVEAELVNINFSRWHPEREYDLIVCNPPYFLPGHGEKNADERKEISRSFVIDGWKDLLDKIQAALSANGKAYFVIRKDQRVLKLIDENLNGLQKEMKEEGNLVFLKLFRLNEN